MKVLAGILGGFLIAIIGQLVIALGASSLGTGAISGVVDFLVPWMAFFVLWIKFKMSFISSILFLTILIFSGSAFAKIDFALSCTGNGKSMVLIADKDVILTTTKPVFNRNELQLVPNDSQEKSFMYVQTSDWINKKTSYDSSIYYFLDRESLRLTNYVKSPPRFGKTNLVATFQCKIIDNAEDANTRTNLLLEKMEEDRKINIEKQLKRNKI